MNGTLLEIAAGTEYAITVHDLRSVRTWSQRTGWRGGRPPPALFLHHSATPKPPEDPALHLQHLSSMADRSPYGLPYNFVLFDGAEPPYYYLNDVDGCWPHTYRFNCSVALAVVGNYEELLPSDALVDRIVRWLGAMRSLWGRPDLQFYAHADVYPTACPGRHLRWITNEF